MTICKRQTQWRTYKAKSLVHALLILALCQQAAKFLLMKFNFENSMAPYPWIESKAFKATCWHSAIRLLGPLSINPLVCLTGFMNESSLGQLKWPNFPDPNHKILTEADQGVRHELMVFYKLNPSSVTLIIFRVDITVSRINIRWWIYFQGKWRNHWL